MKSTPRQRRRTVHLICSTLGVMACEPVQAQITGGSLVNAAEEKSVGARSKENYAPSGIPVGTFRLFASAETRLTYDDNVFNVDVPRLSDRVAILSPRLEMRSQSPTYNLVVSADASIQRFDKLRSQDNTQFDLAASGGVRIGNAAGLTVGAFYGRRSELRGTTGDVVIGAPNQYDRLGSSVGAAIELVDLRLAAGFGVESLDYKPVRVNETTVSQDFRDIAIYSGTFGASLLVGSGLRLVAKADFNEQRYREESGTIDRNSHGYAVLGGVDFGLNELISGEVGIGYLSQMYNQGPVQTVDGLTYRGKIVWNPTTLLTATISGGRTLEQSPFFNQAGVIQDNVALLLDYELLRNLIVSVSQQVTLDKFRGLDRSDRLYTTDASVRLLINRTFEAGLRINHRNQSSSGTFARRYTGTSATISLIVKR